MIRTDVFSLTGYGRPFSVFMELQEHEALVWFGGEVKALDDDGRIGGYLVRFSTAADPDLAGDFFSSKTDFGPATSSPIMYHHGQDPSIKMARLGMGDLKVDDVGAWIEGQLELRDEYERAIFQMAKDGKLGWSSGTASHLVEREAVGKAFHIKSWPLGLDASLTPTPCEPRTKAIPLKSYLAELQTAETENAETDAQSVVVPVDDGNEAVKTARLAAALNRAIDGMVTDKKPRSAIISMMARAAGISESTVSQILRNEIDMPPMNRLRGFARVLGISAAQLAKLAGHSQTAKMKQENTGAEHLEVQESIYTAPEIEIKAQPTSVITLSKADYDALQAKAFSQPAERIVKAQHQVSTASVNLKTKRGDSFESSYVHWIKTGDVGAVKSIMAEDETNNSWNDARTGSMVSIKADVDMQVGTDAEGGHLVPEGHFQSIISRRDEAMVAAKLGVRNIPGKGTTVHVPLDGDGNAAFTSTAEEAASTRDTPVVGNAAMTLVKYTKRVPISDELMIDEDSGLLTWISDWVGRGMGITHNQLLVAAAAAGGTSTKTFASATTIAAGELQDMLFNDALEAYLDDTSSVSWLTRRSTHGVVAKLQGDNFIYDSNPQGNGNFSDPRISGVPVAYSVACDALATTNDPIFLANWFYMGVRNEPEFRVLRDPYSAASTGQLNLHYFFRTVYSVLQAEAVTFGTLA